MLFGHYTFTRTYCSSQKSGQDFYGNADHCKLKEVDFGLVPRKVLMNWIQSLGISLSNQGEPVKDKYRMNYLHLYLKLRNYGGVKAFCMRLLFKDQKNIPQIILWNGVELTVLGCLKIWVRSQYVYPTVIAKFFVCPESNWIIWSNKSIKEE